MTTLAHVLSRTLPGPVARWMRPRWHHGRTLTHLYRTGGRVAFHRDLDSWVAYKPLRGREFAMPFRGTRELMRFAAFGSKPDDLVFRWLSIISDCDVLYDFGSANGQEGLFVQDNHGATVVFVEIFPPSIEDILKGVALRLSNGRRRDAFEVVAAGGDAVERHGRVFLHNPPVAGGTLNSFGDPAIYCRGGRQNEPVFGSVWMPSVTVDGLHARLQLPPPSHVKIDVDGLEDRIIAGASETLAARRVRSWMVEVSPGREAPIAAAMTGAGYVEIASHEHYPGENDCWDRLFVRDDLVEDYRLRLREGGTAPAGVTD